MCARFDPNGAHRMSDRTGVDDSLTVVVTQHLLRMEQNSRPPRVCADVHKRMAMCISCVGWRSL